jgi:hypothetical protein
MKADTLPDSTETKNAIWKKQAVEMPGCGKHGKPRSRLFRPSHRAVATRSRLGVTSLCHFCVALTDASVTSLCWKSGVDHEVSRRYKNLSNGAIPTRYGGGPLRTAYPTRSVEDQTTCAYLCLVNSDPTCGSRSAHGGWDYLGAVRDHNRISRPGDFGL